MLTKFQAEPLPAGNYVSEILDDTYTRERIQRHLANPDDRITDEDLLKIKTELSTVQNGAE